MKMQEFWNDLAKDGSWASHYRGEPNLNTYNFYTRREAVMGLLENESNFGRTQRAKPISRRLRAMGFLFCRRLILRLKRYSKCYPDLSKQW